MLRGAALKTTESRCLAARGNLLSHLKRAAKLQMEAKMMKVIPQLDPGSPGAWSGGRGPTCSSVCCDSRN